MQVGHVSNLDSEKSYDSRKKLEIDSIVVQSPLLKDALHHVLRGYPGVTTSLARLTFAAPFRPFVHRWEKLKEAMDNPDHDEITKSHLKLLHDVLYAELKDVISAMGDYIKNGVVTYEHVWTIFQPGCNILSSRYGRPVAVKLEQGNYGEHCKYGPCFILKCDRIDWDGSKFGYDNSQQLVLPFVGTIKITDLECHPLEFHSDVPKITDTLVARGALFESLAGYHYKAYRGQAIEQQQFGPAKISVDCRIVIDAFAHGKFNANQTLSLRPLKKVEVNNNVHSSDSDDEYGYNNRYDDYDSDNDADDFDIPDTANLVPLTPEELILCTPMIRGYALKIKKWVEFFVDCVTEVRFNEDAFESLVLPKEQKQLILAFAESQVKYKEVFDDVISGKGKGVIMLLSGGPGIGKTLTAESVAETMRVPLYMMSAGDLGVGSWQVEENLARVLEMVAKWNAVLLLDECDVFLEARSKEDLDRNRIVSIFLRTLEYYEGILFLTTNRVDDMDPAFHSRIHISLEYPPLDTSARRAVWNGFLGRTVDIHGKAGKSHDLTDSDIEKLATLDINGRQIKNVLKMGNLLAFHTGERLAFTHLQTVLKVEGHTLE
jgi:hypothetical protein